MLIADILEMQKQIGENSLNEATLSKMAKSELEQLLGVMYNKVAKLVEEKRNAETANLEGTTDIIVKNLFIMNLLVVGILEKGSEKIKDSTYGIAMLEGMTQNVKDTKDELMDILRRVYLQHHSVIQKFCTPLALWLGYMSKTVAFTAFDNFNKKKKQQSAEQIEECN